MSHSKIFAELNLFGSFLNWIGINLTLPVISTRDGVNLTLEIDVTVQSLVDLTLQILLRNLWKHVPGAFSGISLWKFKANIAGKQLKSG